MNRPFAIYPDSFDGTLAYWRFGETGGRLADVVGGKVLTNHGTEARQDGRRFVRDDPDYMDCAFTGLPEIKQVTLECWLRAFTTQDLAYGFIASFGKSNEWWVYCLRFYPRLNTGGGTAKLYCDLFGGGDASWDWNTDAYDLLTGPDPIHLAAVMDSDAPYLRFFVNGTKVGEDVVGINPLPAGNYTLCLGDHFDHAGTYALSGVLDEVRVSNAIRYSSDFPVTRYGEGRRAVARGPGLDGLFAGVAA